MQASRQVSRLVMRDDRGEIRRQNDNRRQGDNSRTRTQ